MTIIMIIMRIFFVGFQPGLDDIRKKISSELKTEKPGLNNTKKHRKNLKGRFGFSAICLKHFETQQKIL